MSRSAPPSAPAESPALYMTPQLEKRRDGLAPSFLDLASTPGSSMTGSNFMDIKSYRTSSSFLNTAFAGEAFSDEPNAASVRNDSADLQKIVDSIQSTLESLTDERNGTTDISKLKFKAEGCIWTLTFNPHLRASSFEMTVVCKACEEKGGATCYVVDSLLVPSRGGNASPDDPGYKIAKEVFDFSALQVRKAVVRCEFPDFPEGCKGRAFREIYQLNARLKSGSFATVCRGTHRSTGKKVAIKCVLRKDLPPSDDAAIFDEVAILASLDHPHITPLLDFFEEKDCYFIVMELMGGGDLFDRIGKKKVYTEADARDLIQKMIQAVHYCHVRDIAHCDMKPKNLLLCSEENDSYIKLADFGFAARVHEKKSLTKQCGTPFFVSPEILMREKYDQMTDMWSVGCIVFLLLGGNLPFMGRSQKELFKKIVVGKYEFGPDWNNVSDDAKDLVRKLLVTDPDNRLSAEGALRHKWLLDSRQRLALMRLTGTSQRLKTFNARMKLRSAMIAVDWASTLTKTSFASSLRGSPPQKGLSKMTIKEEGEDS